MQVTVSVPDELVSELKALGTGRLPQVLESGIRQLKGDKDYHFVGLTEVLEALARLPTPEEVLDLHPSPALQARIEQLLEKNREQGLSPEEEREWQRYEYLEHMVRMAKAQARLRLKNGGR
jgi:hypothetical protein